MTYLLKEVLMLRMFLFLYVVSSVLSGQDAFYGYRAPLAEKVDPRCYIKDYVRAWIYFTDKGITVDTYNDAVAVVTERMNRSALERRMIRKGTVDHADIPLNQDYVTDVEAHGGLLITESKWLNAASFWLRREDLTTIAQLPFVYKITPVASYRGSGPQSYESVILDTTVFGLTYQQLHMFTVDELHDIGVFGSNVKIGILDTGWKRRHNALSYTKVIAEHDFLSGDRLFIENSAVTDRYGIYSDIVFHKTSSRLNIFLSGDTIRSNLPVRDVLYTYSIDGGTTWTSLEKLTNNFAPNWVNELDACGNDTMFIFYRDNGGIKYLTYTDVLIGSGFLVGTSYRTPSCAQIGDTIYVVYHSKNTLYLRKGTTSGFTTATVLDSASSQIKAPTLVGSAAHIGIVYNTYPDDSLFFIQSSIPETTFTKTFITRGKEAEAVAFGDTLFVVWKDATYAPLWRIGFSMSTDFGQTFNQPRFLSEEVNSIGKISIAKNDEIVVAWECDGRIYSRASYDNGNSFVSLDSLDKQFVYLPTLGTTAVDIVTFYCERGDSIADDEGTNHGSKMLGLMGGYLTDTYVGVAPGAQFLIAKTENPSDAYEFPVEEDTWINGLEWLESQGAEIVNSSLGYSDWYEWPGDFDGKTSPAPIAGYEATRRGMIVVAAAGNIPNFYLASPRIVMPGDADGIITVGGIDTLYNHWKSPNVFAGYYPTPDHSVKKPELVCLSAAPIVIDPDSVNSYLYSFGTSGATALVSGICALLLEGHSTWNVDSVRNALFNTASRATTPSDSMGYGWPQTLAAFNYSQPDYEPVTGNVFLTPYPNPFILSQHDRIYWPFKLDMSYSVNLKIYSLSGRLINEQRRLELLTPGTYTDENPQSPNAAFSWDGTDEEGNDVASGVYYCLLITRGGGNDIVKIAVVR
jgi:hypothetical protein